MTNTQLQRFPKQHLVIAVLLSLILGGCGALLPTKAYDPPRVNMARHREELFQQVKSYVSRVGWDLREDDPLMGRITAWEAVTAEDGTRERNRWTFDIDEGSIRAQRMYEIFVADDAKWISSGRVCDKYAYSVERDLVERIAQAGGPVAAAEPVEGARE